MTQLARTVALAVALTALTTSDVLAQRGGRAGGGALPRLVSPGPTMAPPVRPSMAGRGVATVPRTVPGGHVRGGDLPRITSEFPRHPGSGRGLGSPTRGGNRGSRIWSGSSTRWGVGAGCGFGCFRSGGSIRIGSGRFSGSFFFGHPFAGFPFLFPVVIPYPYPVVYDSYYDRMAESDYAVREPQPAASKLIVVGAGSAGGGDALTIETLADSVRLTWLGTARPAREVRLFVTDSAQHQLASRSASPSAPVATFEIATLSAPVAFAGVTVVFADGVTSTTVVPYRGGSTIRNLR